MWAATTHGAARPSDEDVRTPSNRSTPMSYIDYHVAVVMADRAREAEQARRSRVPRRKPRRTFAWPSRRARLRIRPA